MYKAIVCRITTRPHPNADRLKIASAYGHQVVVGLTAEDGDLGLFFPTDGQLSEAFAAANDLVRRVDAQGNKAGGMFEQNRRVRAQSLRGVKSDGFWCPLSYLAAAEIDTSAIETLREGDTLDSLGGVAICNKYMTPATLQAQHQRVQKRVISSFPEHVETEPYKYARHAIQPGSVVYVSEKLHGTSQRYGLVEVERPLKWYERWLQRLGVPVEAKTYQYVIGTRRTILEDGKAGYYGSEQFRRDVVSGITLKPGEILYFEVVGYTTDEKFIMGEQGDTKKAGLEQYGPVMRYTYGCEPGTCRMYVYRITQHGTELSHFQMHQRCQELGLQTVPHIDMLCVYDTETMSIVDTIIDSHISGSSELDSRHIREGVCLRVESTQGTQFIKAKSWEFGVLEGYIKDKADYVDTEEVA
jgi:hypothetical protein